jgi:hypothetical protein
MNKNKNNVHFDSNFQPKPELMSKKLAKQLAKVEEEIKAGHISEVFTDAESFLADLHK